jgi:hypothetical protein
MSACVATELLTLPAGWGSAAVRCLTCTELFLVTQCVAHARSVLSLPALLREQPKQVCMSVEANMTSVSNCGPPLWSGSSCGVWARQCALNGKAWQPQVGSVGLVDVRVVFVAATVCNLLASFVDSWLTLLVCLLACSLLACLRAWVHTIHATWRTVSCSAYFSRQYCY